MTVEEFLQARIKEMHTQAKRNMSAGYVMAGNQQKRIAEALDSTLSDSLTYKDDEGGGGDLSYEIIRNLVKIWEDHPDCESSWATQ